MRAEENQRAVDRRIIGSRVISPEGATIRVRGTRAFEGFAAQAEDAREKHWRRDPGTDAGTFGAHREPESQPLGQHRACEWMTAPEHYLLGGFCVRDHLAVASKDLLPIRTQGSQQN